MLVLKYTLSSCFATIAIDQELTYGPKWVTEQIEHYIRGAGASSIKNIMQLMNNEEIDDLNGLLDEMQYYNAMELMILHVKSNTTALRERIHCSDREAGFNVITNLMTASDPSSILTAKIITGSLLYLLSNGEPDKRKWWENRVAISDAVRVNCAVKLELAKFLNTIGTIMLGICTNEYGITDSRINTTIAPEAIFETIESHGHAAYYTNIFNKTNNYLADRVKFTKADGSVQINRYWSKCLKRIGLKVHTKSSSVLPYVKNLSEALCITKALLTDGHYIKITSIIKEDVIAEANSLWEANRTGTRHSTSAAADASTTPNSTQ
ncbi:hypothetical protein V8B55DRAFT_1576457 [Mucor lusitanicus]